jgi:glycosyltransferase involved in cell wall biosynthesis
VTLLTSTALPSAAAPAALTDAPLLFDVTRLVSSRWSGRLATGLDRVAIAYARRLRASADAPVHAVIQYRRLTRVLGRAQSVRLFDLLLDPARRFRREFTWLATGALANARGEALPEGAVYLNVGHTEFDLPEHREWVERTNVRPVYFLHDLIPIRHPHLCRPGAVERHRARVDSALSSGAAIIVNSLATARDLMGYALETRQACPPVSVAPLAADDLPRGGNQRGRAARPYFLAIGTHEPRRNFALLHSVWQRLVARMGDSAPRLVIVGQRWQHHCESFDSLARSSLNPRHIELVCDCTDERLAQLIAGARALLMPTLAEGFGLPLVEALSLGTPVIASNLPSLAESGQGIPLLLDPLDAAGWERAIVEFQEDPAEEKRQAAMIKTYSPPRWDDHFAIVTPFLAGLAGQKDAPRVVDTTGPCRVAMPSEPAQRQRGAARLAGAAR